MVHDGCLQALPLKRMEVRVLEVLVYSSRFDIYALCFGCITTMAFPVGDKDWDISRASRHPCDQLLSSVVSVLRFPVLLSKYT